MPRQPSSRHLHRCPRILDPGRGRTKKGYFWAIARDDRPWGGKDPPAVVYTYAPGRGHEHARALLGSYCGILQCDGYAAYKSLAHPGGKRGPSALVFCWSQSFVPVGGLTIRERSTRPKPWW